MRVEMPPEFSEYDAIGSARNDVLHITAVYLEEASKSYRAKGNMILANDAHRRAKAIFDKLSWKKYFSYY